jgi:CRP-like cAMP-binding protein
LDMTIEMYRLHSERILNLEYRTVRERIISFLLTMSQRFGKQTNGDILIEVPLRHQDIASSVNATRETTSRELSALERKGLLTNKQSLIILHDLPALKKHLD